MTTLTHTRPHLSMDLSATRSRLFMVPIGRLFFALIFLMSGINHFSSGSIGYAASSGVPYPQILVPLSGAMAFLGGLSVALGYKAKMGAILLFLFLVPVTFFMHNFWNSTDPAMVANQMAHFMKNLSLIGGTILFAFYGAGPLSIDNHIAKTHR